jgi:ketosteroid isomerase-like protein
MPVESPNLETARRYLAALEMRSDLSSVLDVFAPDFVQEEFSNRLMPNGARRDLPAIAEARGRGQKGMTAERYDIQSALESGDRVVLEVVWTGTLAVPFGSIPKGGTMRARFAAFLDFRDGQIVRQRNYDCFEPW